MKFKNLAYAIAVAFLFFTWAQPVGMYFSKVIIVALVVITLARFMPYKKIAALVHRILEGKPAETEAETAAEADPEVTEWMVKEGEQKTSEPLIKLVDPDKWEASAAAAEQILAAQPKASADDTKTKVIPVA